jgi:diguanylate cyclase (GGDEF)-like protein
LIVLATRPAVLLVGAVVTTLSAFLAALFVDNGGQEYGLPSLFYLPVVLAGLGAGRRAAVAAAPLVTAFYLAALHHHGTTSVELLTTGTIRLGVAMLIGALIGSAVDHGRHLAAAAQQQAMTDPLTGLGNRRAFDNAWHQRAGLHAGIVVVDMDGLKALNDREGHAEGDRALRALAAAIELGVRPTDTAVRLGGDEFAVLAPLTSADDIRELAERIRHNASRAGVAASVGYALAPQDGLDLTTLVETADARMYLNKTEHHARADAVGTAVAHWTPAMLPRGPGGPRGSPTNRP